MATILAAAPVRARPISADPFERVLAGAALILLIAALAAIGRGHAEWGKVPVTVWLHLATVLTAVALTPVMLLRRRGDHRHRWLGRVWAAAMLLTALSSFAIRLINHGQWSWIHLRSLFVLVQTPMLWWTARKHQVEQHRRYVRGTVAGALVIAGFFTFPFGRLLGHWLMG